MKFNAEILEHGIDRNGLVNVLKSMALICEKKSSHIMENWQDRALAGEWDRAANLIEQVSDKIKTP